MGRRVVAEETAERAAFIISRAAPSNQPVSANTLFARAIDREDWESDWNRDVFDAGLKIAVDADRVLRRQYGFVRRKDGQSDE